VENFDAYDYHEAGVRLKLGMPSPWYEKHDLYFEASGAAQLTIEQFDNWLHGKGFTGKKTIPSYYREIELLPGYTYYYTDTLFRSKTDKTIRDTVLISGATVAKVTGSYRFPLVSRFDTHFWFLYFDKLYGAVNFAAAAGWPLISDARHSNKDNWLSSGGLELRLEALSFDIPMAVKLRWDRGFNRPSPVGGDRFTLGVGFSFDNWEYIDEPDYDRTSARTVRPR
jgi:hypothetical protein